MHDILLALHNIIRWVVFIFGVVVLVRALRGWWTKKAWVNTDHLLGMMFTSAFDMQILLGLVLYFFSSSYGLSAFLNQPVTEVLSSAAYRLYAVVHPLLMFLAAVFAHLGSMLSKKAKMDADKHARAAIFFALALLFLLLGIPWGRPLLPGM